MQPHSDFDLWDSPSPPPDTHASPANSSKTIPELSDITDLHPAHQRRLTESAQSQWLLSQDASPASQPNATLALGVLKSLPKNLLILLASSGILILGMILDHRWLIVAGMIVTFFMALWVLWPSLLKTLIFVVSQELSLQLAAVLGFFLVLLGYLHLTGVLQSFVRIYQQANWDAIGAIGEGIVGAFGQILIAMIALWVAWRQYKIEKELTTQQNLITQQQTIDTYFQGISDLVVDEQGLLEDWPQERAIAEGRTAALLGSVDRHGKAKILRFLSHSNLLSPLRRDRHLGRAILDGLGGFEEDREEGIRVINLKMMLAETDLSNTDLRGVDLSDASFLAANLCGSDLTQTNLSGTILCQANLRKAKLDGARLFYGTLENASPRSRTTRPNLQTGAYTGAVIEDADLTEVRGLSAEQHYYCCAWGGSKTRATIPGGCENIPNKHT
ncbi:MAG: pentapeptide repeat-containing protein [Desmonostoc vinosum HA7617-LM4]|jgi:uncharacterized protein YjbI with pentapeptide repeats|nr:pentapeptide repeat-containing protein [Desmonostoc vinosum HA7617-LM4]